MSVAADKANMNMFGVGLFREGFTGILDIVSEGYTGAVGRLDEGGPLNAAELHAGVCVPHVEAAMAVVWFKP